VTHLQKLGGGRLRSLYFPRMAAENAQRVAFGADLQSADGQAGA
jgi:hypothetical protein